MVRGPSGSGKTTLCRYWARRAPFNFELLSTDEVQDRVDYPELADDAEFEIVLDRVGMEVAGKLPAGPLLVDAGLRDPEHVDRVLELAERGRGDPDVLLVRLSVEVEEAILRKRDLPEARVRELHMKWQTKPIPDEFVLVTDGIPEAEVERRFGEILTEKFKPGVARS